MRFDLRIITRAHALLIFQYARNPETLLPYTTTTEKLHSSKRLYVHINELWNMFFLNNFFVKTIRFTVLLEKSVL